MVIGRDWSNHSLPSCAIAHSTSCGPPKTAATELRERDEAPEIGAGQLRTVVRVELEHLGVGVEQVPRPAYLAAHELFGCAVHRGDDAAVGPARHRVDPEHDATERGLEQRLDQHRDRLVAAPARARESSTCFTATVNASKPRIPMTDSNWPAIDESAVSSTTDELRATSGWSLAGGPRERLVHGWMRIDLGARVDLVGERGREHDAGQRGETRARGSRQRGRLPARQRRVERRLVLELDEQGSRHHVSLVPDSLPQ